jgi:integrase
MSRTPTTRSHGEGSIYRSDYKRAGGVVVERWIASVDVGVGPSGKRVRKKITGRTRKAVADKLRALQREQDAGVDVRKRSMTVADLAREWLMHLENNEGTKEEGTILRLRPRVERHIIPADRIGGRQLDSLTVAHVEAWLRREAESGGKGGTPQARVTCRDYKQMLGEMLEWATARRYVTWNPARIAKLPKDRSATNPDAPPVYKRSKAKESFTREQYTALMVVLTATDDETLKIATPNAYFVAMLSIGARPGEMDALRWPQVDFENRMITVDHAIKRADGGRPLSIGLTKTGNRRDVEMTDLLMAALHRHRRRQAERRLKLGPHWTMDPRWTDLVFTSEVGTPIDPSHARRDFRKTCVQAGVPALSLYEIRHTVASLMVDADVPLREVADLLGHKDLEMVVKRYRHRTDGVVKSHVAVLGSLTADRSSLTT